MYYKLLLFVLVAGQPQIIESGERFPSIQVCQAAATKYVREHKSGMGICEKTSQ